MTMDTCRRPPANYLFTSTRHYLSRADLYQLSSICWIGTSVFSNSYVGFAKSNVPEYSQEYSSPRQSIVRPNLAPRNYSQKYSPALRQIIFKIFHPPLHT